MLLEKKKRRGIVKMISRDEAFDLLKKYNTDSFHIQHALTVEAVMKWYANELGYADEKEYWGIVGLLHDIDFELYPDEHCLKAPELLKEGSVSEDIREQKCVTKGLDFFSAPISRSLNSVLLIAGSSIDISSSDRSVAHSVLKD